MLYAPLRGKVRKPRTYRQKARKVYIQAAKAKRRSRAKIRAAVGKQLRFLSRNRKHINTLVKKGSSLGLLSRYQYKCLLVIATVYEQQLQMYEQRTHRVEGRIVSISQPHVRPIVRGKAAAAVEFGVKISVSAIEGYTFIDRLSWENFNEGTDLIGQVQTYRQRFGTILNQCMPIEFTAAGSIDSGVSSEEFVYQGHLWDDLLNAPSGKLKTKPKPMNSIALQLKENSVTPNAKEP